LHGIAPIAVPERDEEAQIIWKELHRVFPDRTPRILNAVALHDLVMEHFRAAGPAVLEQYTDFHESFPASKLFSVLDEVYSQLGLYLFCGLFHDMIYSAWLGLDCSWHMRHLQFVLMTYQPMAAAFISKRTDRVKTQLRIYDDSLFGDFLASGIDTWLEAPGSCLLAVLSLLTAQTREAVRDVLLFATKLHQTLENAPISESDEEEEVGNDDNENADKKSSESNKKSGKETSTHGNVDGGGKEGTNGIEDSLDGGDSGDTSDSSIGVDDDGTDSLALQGGSNRAGLLGHREDHGDHGDRKDPDPPAKYEGLNGVRRHR